MQGELLYGNDRFSGNGEHASGKFDTFSFCKQEEQEVTLTDVRPHLDIHNSNARLDNYLFHFSSKL